MNAMIAPATATLAGYQLRLPTFEGPLDVLLSLIERERLEISELSLVAVTDGFLAYLEGLHEPPPALLAEFAGVAARLLVLKSRALLPRPQVDEPEADVDDLAAQLREYQRAKQVAGVLREIEQSGRRSYARQQSGEPSAGPAQGTAPTAPRIVLLAPPVAQLRRALLRSLERVRPEPEVAPLRRVVSIGEMIDRLRARLHRFRRAWRFRELVAGAGREETVAGFIALLSLWRRGEVEVRQAALFGDIQVTQRAPESGLRVVGRRAAGGVPSGPLRAAGEASAISHQLLAVDDE